MKNICLFLVLTGLVFAVGAPRIGQQDVAASGTAEALSAVGTRILCSWVTVQAKTGNTGNVCVGDSNVICASAPAVELEPGWSHTYPPMDRRQHYDLRDVYVDADTNDDGVSWVCYQ